MKIFLTLITLLLLVAPAVADHHEGGEAAMPDMGPMGRPAEMDAIDFLLGEWTVEISFKLDPASEEWTTSAGTAVTTAVLDGCVQRMDFASTVMGMPFKGLELSSYNREYGYYESVWIDDMGAKMTIMTGNFQGDDLILEGPDKMQGMEFLNRSVCRKVSDDEVYFAMAMSMDGGATWVDHMKMTYTRKK